MDIIVIIEVFFCVENGGYRFGYNRMLVVDKIVRLKDYNEFNIFLVSNESVIIDFQNRYFLKGVIWNQVVEIIIYLRGNDFNDDNDLELILCYSYKVIDYKMQKLKRRSIYDVIDIEVIFCFGLGWVKLLDKKFIGSNIVDILEYFGSAKDFIFNGISYVNKLLIKGNNLVRYGI